MRPQRPRQRGYLVVLMAICAAVMTISYLRLAAGSVRVNEQAEAEGRRLAAYYAAESGLIHAEADLGNFKGRVPSPGVHWQRDISSIQGRFRVEVRAEGRTERSFLMRSTGTVQSVGGTRQTVEMEAKVLKDKGGNWIVHSRTLIE